MRSYTWICLSWHGLWSYLACNALFDKYPSGCDEVWECKPVFTSKNSPPFPVPTYRGIKMSLDDLRLRNRSIDRFRFQFIALDNVGSFSFYGANGCSFRSQSFHFVTLSPRLIGGEIVTLRHSSLLPWIFPSFRTSRVPSSVCIVSAKEKIVLFFARRGIGATKIYTNTNSYSQVIFQPLTNFDSNPKIWMAFLISRAKRGARCNMPAGYLGYVAQRVSTCLVTCLPSNHSQAVHSKRDGRVPSMQPPVQVRGLVNGIGNRYLERLHCPMPD